MVLSSLYIRYGLVYLDMPFTDTERDKHPPVVMTNNFDWNLSVLDNNFPLHGDKEFLGSADYDNGTNFDAFGNYQKGTIIASTRLDHHPILPETIQPDDILIAKVAVDDLDINTVIGDDLLLDSY